MAVVVCFGLVFFGASSAAWRARWKGKGRRGKGKGEGMEGKGGKGGRLVGHVILSHLMSSFGVLIRRGTARRSTTEFCLAGAHLLHSPQTATRLPRLALLLGEHTVTSAACACVGAVAISETDDADVDKK